MANERMMADVLRQQPASDTSDLSAVGAVRNIRQAAAYKRYATEAAAMGETPKTYEQWLKGQ